MSDVAPKNPIDTVKISEAEAFQDTKGFLEKALGAERPLYPENATIPAERPGLAAPIGFGWAPLAKDQGKPEDGLTPEEREEERAARGAAGGWRR